MRRYQEKYWWFIWTIKCQNLCIREFKGKEISFPVWIPALAWRQKGAFGISLGMVLWNQGMAGDWCWGRGAARLASQSGARMAHPRGPDSSGEVSNPKVPALGKELQCRPAKYSKQVQVDKKLEQLESAFYTGWKDRQELLKAKDGSETHWKSPRIAERCIWRDG